jgi:hypothetical protein
LGEPGLILHVLPESGDGADDGEHKKREPGHFQPKLMRHPAERSPGGPRALHDRGGRPRVARVPDRDSRGDLDLSPCGDFSHESILAVQGRTIRMGKSQRPVISAVRDWCVCRGGFVDPQLKQLMKELGEAINESLADSEQIAEVVARIKEGGYDIFLVLEATIGVSKQGVPGSDKTSLVSTLSTNPELKVSDQDLKFLKSLRIKIEEEEEEVE